LAARCTTAGCAWAEATAGPSRYLRYGGRPANGTAHALLVVREAARPDRAGASATAVADAPAPHL